MHDTTSAPLDEHLDRAVDFVESEIAKGHAVLIHCAAGVSRSSTVTIAYLMKKQNMTVRAAHAHVLARRPIIRPNYHFALVLMRLDGSEDAKKWYCEHISQSLMVLQDVDQIRAALEEHDWNVPIAVDALHKNPPQQTKENECETSTTIEGEEEEENGNDDDDDDDDA